MTAQRQKLDYQALDETELLALARQGDQEAFRAIMTRCNQRLYRVARSVMRDSGEAEDVVQEAYTSAFANLANFRGDSSLMTWLTSITLNEARGRLRRSRRTVAMDAVDAERAPGADILLFPGFASSSDPERELARSQWRGLIENALDQLPEPFRLVFMMRDVEECSIEETAVALGLKPETVRTRLFRARRQLRQILENHMSSGVGEVFSFLGARCARITEAVLHRLAPQFGW
ncbi:MAG TPA: RNA polymerase sigma factor [Micropepsaceae bacterium]|nr:RNA polymerase sigma factor [Micropepsaceae bacterium]